MSPRLLSVREAMAQYLVENGWSPASAELMAWAVHPFDREGPTPTKTLQKDVKRRAAVVGQRSQGLAETDAVALAVQALVSYQHSAVQDGNEALARVWGEVVAEHAATGTPPAAPVAEPVAEPEPQPTEVAVAVAVPGAPGVARPGPVAVDWVHAVTLPPRRLGQLGSLDRALEPIGPFATAVLAAHLVATLPAGDPDRDRLAERAALAGYLVELDLAGVTPDALPEPDGPDLRLAAVRAATDELTSFDLGALARRHSPAASSVAERLAGEDAGSERQDLVARSLGAGLALAARRRLPD